MNGKIAVVLLSGSLSACVQAQPPAASVAAPPPAAAVPAPAPTRVAAAMPEAAPAGDRYVTIRSARCATLLGLPEDDRAAASLFYIGYQASRLGARSINANAIPATESEALNYCRTFPNRTVAEAFAKAISARPEITRRARSRGAAPLSETAKSFPGREVGTSRSTTGDL